MEDSTGKTTLSVPFNTWPSGAVHSPEKIRSNCTSHNWPALTIQKNSTTFTCLVMTFRKGKRLRPLECTILYKKGFCLIRFGSQTSDFLGKPRVVYGDFKQYSLSAVMRETAAVIVLGFPLIFVPASGHESDSKCICKSL